MSFFSVFFSVFFSNTNFHELLLLVLMGKQFHSLAENSTSPDTDNTGFFLLPAFG